MVKFAVDGNSYCLKGLFAGVLVTSELCGNALTDNIRKLSGCLNRLFFPVTYDSVGDPRSKFLLAVSW